MHKTRAAVERDKVSRKHLPQISLPSAILQCAFPEPVFVLEMLKWRVIAQAQQSFALQLFLHRQRMT